MHDIYVGRTLRWGRSLTPSVGPQDCNAQLREGNANDDRHRKQDSPSHSALRRQLRFPLSKIIVNNHIVRAKNNRDYYLNCYQSLS